MAMAWDVKRPSRRGDASAAAPKKAATPAPPSPAAGPGYRFEDIAPTAPGRPASGAALPAPLRHGIRHLSGVALDDVGVHYNSAKPRDVGAEATAQGNAIHLAPGRERHLPHEAWHLVQQRQGRVRPTMQMKGVAINDDDGLEREADRMGALAARAAASPPSPVPIARPSTPAGVAMPIQRGGAEDKIIRELKALQPKFRLQRLERYIEVCSAYSDLKLLKFLKSLRNEPWLKNPGPPKSMQLPAIGAASSPIAASHLVPHAPAVPPPQKRPIPVKSPAAAALSLVPHPPAVSRPQKQTIPVKSPPAAASNLVLTQPLGDDHSILTMFGIPPQPLSLSTKASAPSSYRAAPLADPQPYRHEVDDEGDRPSPPPPPNRMAQPRQPIPERFQAAANPERAWALHRQQVHKPPHPSPHKTSGSPSTATAISSATSAPVPTMPKPAPLAASNAEMAKAEENLKKNAPKFANADHKIITPHILSNEGEANCHGYTVNRKYSWINGEELLGKLKRTDNVVVFVDGGRIGHSARIEGGRLIHYLIGIGVVSSPVGGSYDYSEKFELPNERAALDKYLNDHEAKQKDLTRRKKAAAEMADYLEKHEKALKKHSDFESLKKEVDENYENVQNDQNKNHYKIKKKFNNFMKNKSN